MGLKSTIKVKVKITRKSPKFVLSFIAACTGIKYTQPIIVHEHAYSRRKLFLQIGIRICVKEVTWMKRRQKQCAV